MKHVVNQGFSGFRGLGGNLEDLGDFENVGGIRDSGGILKLCAEYFSPIFLTNHMSRDQHRLALDHCAGVSHRSEGTRLLTTDKPEEIGRNEHRNILCG